MRKVSKKQFFSPEFITLLVMTVTGIVISAAFIESISLMASCCGLLVAFCALQYLLCENENLRLDYYEVLNQKYELLLEVRNQFETINNLKKGKKK